MGLMTAETRLAAVHHYRRERALLHAMTALAVGSLVALDRHRRLPQTSVERASVDRNARRLGLERCFAGRALQRERVATRAGGFGSRTEPLRSICRGVLDVPLFFVTGGAAIRRHCTHLVCRGRMALRAVDLLPLDVDAMTNHIARKAPGFVHVNARPPLPVVRRGFVLALRRFFLVRARGKCRKQEYWDQHPCKH